MPTRHWKRHLTRFALGVVAAVLLGWLSGHPVEVILAASLLYTAWISINCLRLLAWLRTGEDQVPESVGIWSDIFDRINDLRQQTIRQQQRYRSVIEEYQSLSDALPDAALVLDTDDTLEWFNDTAHQLIGLRMPEDLGQPVTNLIREPDFADWIAVDDQVEEHFEMAAPRDPNRRLSVRSIHYREGKRLLLLRDVTEVSSLERIRRDFVANVSHELRTPLTVLLGYLEAVHDQCSTDIQPVIERMQGQGQQMQALLADLLELSRLQSGERETDDRYVDVPAMLAALKEQSEELSRGRHQLRFEVEPGLGIRGNATDLESAFRNLINNAINYTPEGGSIRVRWEQRPEGSLVFSVADSGVGIPARDIPRLTERFYRVGADRSRSSGGTGLGLSIVKHVLNTHQARLEIKSELGTGSSFRCVFPAERTSPETA